MKQKRHRPLIKQAIQLMLSIASCVLFVSAHAQIPLLNSYPSASATVYLDFDGERVEGTLWNQRGPINANPADLSCTDIREIFNRVAEDFHPFNINITTDARVYRNAPISQRIRIIFTSDNNWYGNSAGASCVGSFIWGDDTPAWVFSNMLGNNPRFIASCASHEIGHTLGLQHQSIFDTHGGKIAEYNGGAGTTENGWAPIMGVSYYKNCTVWQNGISAAGSDSLQMDADIIADSLNHFGYRADDYGDDHKKAGMINVFAQQFSIKGIINFANDRDVFQINIDSRQELRLNLVPNYIPGRNEQTDGTCIKLLNANADTIARYEPVRLMYSGIDIILDPGTYYFVISDKSHNHFTKPSFYAMSGSLSDADHIRQFAMNDQSIR